MASNTSKLGKKLTPADIIQLVFGRRANSIQVIDDQLDYSRLPSFNGARDVERKVQKTIVSGAQTDTVIATGKVGFITVVTSIDLSVASAPSNPEVEILFRDQVTPADGDPIIHLDLPDVNGVLIKDYTFGGKPFSKDKGDAEGQDVALTTSVGGNYKVVVHYYLRRRMENVDE